MSIETHTLRIASPGVIPVSNIVRHAMVSRKWDVFVVKHRKIHRKYRETC